MISGGGEGGKCPGTWRNTRSGSSAQPRMRSEKTTVVGVERAIQCDDGRTTVYAQADGRRRRMKETVSAT